MELKQGSDKFPLGSQLPSFSLKNVDEVEYDIMLETADAAAVLVVFTCNHCPYVKGSEELLIQYIKEFVPQGLKVVAINSNDPMQYPEDSFEEMQKKASQLNLPYPYLFDSEQLVAKLFDAACTPECFLFDRHKQLVYHGAINDSHRDPSKVTRQYLVEVLRQVLQGAAVQPSFVRTIGCSIKWKH